MVQSGRLVKQCILSLSITLLFPFSALGGVWKVVVPVVVPVVFKAQNGDFKRVLFFVPQGTAGTRLIKLIIPQFKDYFPGTPLCKINGLKAFPQQLTVESVAAFCAENEFICEQMAVHADPDNPEPLFAHEEIERKKELWILSFQDRPSESLPCGIPATVTVIKERITEV